MSIMMTIIQTRHYHSPVGELLLATYGGALCMCDWLIEPRHKRINHRIQASLNAPFDTDNDAVVTNMTANEKAINDNTLTKATQQLDEYFAGNRTTFDIPLLFIGTDFQKKVWNCLLKTPYGNTISYGEMAQQLNCPKAVRAVANANGANAISIFTPCHRVIGSNGQLTGYAGGLTAKQFLIGLEQTHSKQSSFF